MSITTAYDSRGAATVHVYGLDIAQMGFVVDFHQEDDDLGDICSLPCLIRYYRNYRFIDSTPIFTQTSTLIAALII